MIITISAYPLHRASNVYSSNNLSMLPPHVLDSLIEHGFERCPYPLWRSPAGIETSGNTWTPSSHFGASGIGYTIKEMNTAAKELMDKLDSYYQSERDRAERLVKMRKAFKEINW